MTWGRTLKKALQRNSLPTDFSKWRELAADRGYLRGQINGTTTHRNELTKHLDKTTDWKWPLLRNLHTFSPTDESRRSNRKIHHDLAKRISFGLCCLLFAQCKTKKMCVYYKASSPTWPSTFEIAMRDLFPPEPYRRLQNSF